MDGVRAVLKGVARWLPLALAVVALWPYGASGADLILRSRVRASDRGAPSEITHYWTPKRLVEDMPLARVIADLEARTVTVADKQTRTYYVWSFDEFRRVGAEAAGKLADARSKLAQLPPETRRKMPAMARAMASMGEFDADGPRWTVRPAGVPERIAGYATEEYAIGAGSVIGSVWAARELQPPFSAEDLAAFRAASAGTPRFGLNPLDRLPGVDGVLLRSHASLPGPDGVTVSMEVLEVARQAPPPEMLQPPVGFAPATPPARPPAGPERTPPAP